MICQMFPVTFKNLHLKIKPEVNHFWRTGSGLSAAYLSVQNVCDHTLDKTKRTKPESKLQLDLTALKQNRAAPFQTFITIYNVHLKQRTL